MYKTILTTFFNEEYLLPWWLNHHKKHFDHGVLVNYASTDNSVDIIRNICPSWDIIDSRNSEFGAMVCDEEVIDIERNIQGWKACMNVTEFLVGDFSIFDEVPNQGITIPCNVMVDLFPEEVPQYNQPLTEQKRHGIHFSKCLRTRRPRIVHNREVEFYPLGRHYDQYNTDKLQVFWYGWSPFNEEVINRKLQIQTRIPQSDKNMGYGAEHIISKEQLVEKYKDLLTQVEELL